MLPMQALACSCSRSLGHNSDRAVIAAMRSADVVVVATVQEVVSSDISVALGDTTYDMRKSPEDIAEFLVIESFQGSAPGAKLHTWMSTSTAFCGRSFVLGATYLLYLRQADRFGYYRAGLCSRTKSAEGADHELDILRYLAA